VDLEKGANVTRGGLGPYVLEFRRGRQSIRSGDSNMLTRRGWKTRKGNANTRVREDQADSFEPKLQEKRRTIEGRKIPASPLGGMQKGNSEGKREPASSERLASRGECKSLKLKGPLGRGDYLSNSTSKWQNEKRKGSGADNAL